MGSHTNKTTRSAKTTARSSRSVDGTTVILDAIRRIVHVLRTGSRAAEKRSKLSGAQLFVLAVLGEGPVMSLNELANRTRTHQSSVSVVVSRLVKHGLVSRTRRVGTDARRLELRLTVAGHARRRDAPDPVQDRLIAAIDQLPVRDRAQLAGLLSKVVAGLGIPDETTAAMFFEDGGKRTGKGIASVSVVSRGRHRKGSHHSKGSAHGAS